MLVPSGSTNSSTGGEIVVQVSTMHQGIKRS